MSYEADGSIDSGRRERTVTPCNLRASGLLSNESTRQLRSVHETFARALSHALDLFLGSPLEVKLLKVDQTGAREFGSTLAGGSYLVSFGLQPMQERVIAKFENGLLFQLLDLLMGGPGDPLEHTREVSEIDEELFRSVTELISAQLERVWKVCGVCVSPLSSVRPAMLGQLLALEERVVTLQFEVRIGSSISSFWLVLPATFTSALVRNSQAEAVRRVGLASGSLQRLRDRLLDCSMPLSVELRGISIPVGELIALMPGSILDLRTAATGAIEMYVGGYPFFEVTPIRRGGLKSARISRVKDREGCTR